MAFSKNYDKIVAYLNSSPENRQEHFQEMLELSVELFNELKEVLQTGTPEEKREFLKVVDELQKRFEEEAIIGAQRAGYEHVPTVEEALETFDPEQKERIMLVRKEIDRASSEVQQILKGKSPSEAHHPKERKPRPPKKGWLQS